MRTGGVGRSNTMRQRYKILHHLLAIFFIAFLTYSVPLPTFAAEKNWTLTDYKKSLNHIQRSPALVRAIDNALDKLPEGAKRKTEIDLHLWKLDVLVKLNQSVDAAKVASDIYTKYDRHMFNHEEHYGQSMYSIVESLAKTDQLDVSYKIIQNLRESVYNEPSDFLTYIIDKALIEVYIETYDHERALDVALSVLNNPIYAGLDDAKKSRPSLLNEVAFLYNRLGDGENALIYLAKASESFESQDLSPTQLIKARARSSGNRARSYLLLGMYQEAQDLARITLEGGETLGETYMIALGYRLMGSATFNLGEFEEANIYLKKGIELAEKHNLVVMKKPLYRDYSLSLEETGQYQDALFWKKKLYQLELDIHDALHQAREELSNVEFEALKSHQEMVKLRKEFDLQREISRKDKNLQKHLMVTIVSLLAGAGFLICLIVYMRKTQRILRDSEQEAQSANKAKSEFLATMSHEIRTPMNGVLGMAQVLEKTKLTDQQRFYVDIMSKSGENLLAIINDILDFSKIEAKKLKLYEGDHDLDQLLQDVVALLELRTKEKSIDLKYSYQTDLNTNFVFDDHRVRQIVTNLIGNAIKFTAKGHVDVSVTGEILQSKKRGKIRIAISDTGIGISKEKLRVIFDKFTQAESSTTRKYGGTGLGLAISKKLVEAMGGDLRVSSEIGTGSKFQIDFEFDLAAEQIKTSKPVKKLERDQGANPSPDNPANKIATGATSQTAIGAAPRINTHVGNMKSENVTSDTVKTGIKNKIKILVVEDNEINQTVIKTMLSHPRLELICADNGKQAVEVFSAQKFDLILMDISMPVMDGISATKIIRQKEALENRKPTPIICLTAHAMKKDRDAFLKAGMDDYLPKPIEKAKLLKLMRVWLQPKARAA